MHNIMYVITELDVGGAEKTLFELTTRLDRKRFSPRIACLTGRGPMGTKFAEHDIPVHHLDMANKADFLPIFRLRKLLKKHDIHILHSFLFHANMVGRIAAFLARTPIVISGVRVAEPRRHHLWWDRRTSFMIDVEVCVSETIRHFTAAEARIDPNKLITISNGIDLSKYKIAKTELPEHPTVVSVGRLHAQKGMHLLVEAASEVLRHHPDAMFLIAGRGPLEKELEAQITAMGLTEKVKLLGWVQNVPGLLSRASIFVLPSLWEGMPNAVLEAMAAGLPIIASDVDGCRELVVEEKTGILVPTGDSTALSQAIMRLLTSPETATSMGKAGRERVRRQFTIKQMVQANEELYLKLLSQGS